MGQSDLVRKGVAVCVPSANQLVPKAWAFALRFLDPPINLYSSYFSPEGLAVDEARNQCVQYARDMNAKYLMFLDEDTVPAPNALQKFIFHMENNDFIQVLGGVYFSKSVPSAPLIFRGNGAGSYWDWKVGEMFWATGLGMGCTLIRMSVFDKLESPYFLTIKADAHIDAVAKAEAWTEDLYFCEKVLKAHGWTSSQQALEGRAVTKKLAKPIWCDASVICDHWDIKNCKVYGLPQLSKPAVRRFAVGKKKVLDVGCGEVATILKDGLPVRADMRDDVNADYRCDVRDLPFQSESFDVVFSSHTLEHFQHGSVPRVLDEWLRVLKPGGELRLIVPDLEVAAKRILEGNLDREAFAILYGGQSAQWDFHKTGFTSKTLRELLESKGLRIKKIWTEPPLNLFVEAVKEKALTTVGTGQGRAILKSELPENLRGGNGSKPEKIGELKLEVGDITIPEGDSTSKVEPEIVTVDGKDCEVDQ